MKHKSPQRINRLKLEKECEKLLKQVVIIRDKSTCQYCGKYVEGQGRHLSHVKTRRRSPNLKFDLRNVKILCYNCHINWWHKEPTEAGKWFETKYPDRSKYLEERKNGAKLTESDIQELIEIYRSML